MSIRFRASVVAVALALTATVQAIAAPTETPGAVPAVTPDHPLRLVPNDKPIRDGSGKSWHPDTPYATGGNAIVATGKVRGTANPALYRHERRGVSGYRIPVSTPGTYFVNLFTTELLDASPGQRVWNVTAEGRAAATSVDVAHSAGRHRAWHVMFEVPVLDGALTMRIRPHAGSLAPVVAAVEVDFQSSNASTQTLFSDDFDGAAGSPPSTIRWRSVEGGTGWGNHEQESYTSRPSNLSVDGQGHLLITARRETYTGKDGIRRPYTSARIDTAGRFGFQYGRAWASIRVPTGTGLWPAFWTVGDNFNSVGWPRCGEMDVMENRGSQPRIVHGVVHAGRSGGGAWLSGKPLRHVESLAHDYHTYGVVWGPSGVAMSFDGRTYMTLSTADVAPQQLWNFNHSFHLVLNLAVGGDWPGPPTDTTPFPAVMSVDYVRVSS